MFKVFGVTNQKDDPLTAHDGSEMHNQEVDVHIHERDVHEHESDVGQIALDILDTASEIIIVAPVAGVDPEAVDIALSRNILTISGNRDHPPIYLDAKRMLVEECFYGAFSRSVILPENLAFNKIRATISFNTIMVHIPKIHFSSKSIKIEGPSSLAIQDQSDEEEEPKKHKKSRHEDI